MSITTYSELVTAAQNWMDWTDSVSSARIPECITLSEGYLNRKLRTREMLATATLTPSSGVATLPTDFLQVKNVIWTGSPADALEEWDDVTFEKQYGATNNIGTARAYMIRGSSLYVGPIDGTALTLVYYQTIPALTVSNTTNWLLTKYPDVYLYGTLYQANAFRKNAQAAALWKQLRDDACDGVNISGAFYRGPAPSMKRTGATP